MITFTSVEAQNRFGELIDRSQREPVKVTRRGRTVAYVISEHDLRELTDVRERRQEAADWYAGYLARLADSRPTANRRAELTDAEVDRLVHELR